MKQENKPEYRIIGAYDSETTNITENGRVSAFPILHQLGILDGTSITEIAASNVEQHVDIELYRHSTDFYERLDSIVEAKSDYVPVILCHNLSFDMYGIAPWLSRHEVKVLAKSARKPITFSILDENGKPALVIWDTLIFTQTSLERMGKDCGYSKAVGKWDYELIRTPETPLTADELEYARKDIYTLVAYMGWWLRRNPDIAPEKLALNVVTKTGVVRERRKVRFMNVRGQDRKYAIGKYWLFQNKKELPKSDDELFTMQAAMRGGFTFCASRCASVPFDLRDMGAHVYAFDATSQHPAQIASHYFPEDFHAGTERSLTLAFELVQLVSLERVLDKWENPFNVAFYGCFEFENLRLKPGTVFERFGIAPLASARYKSVEFVMNEDNGDKAAHDANRADLGYTDYAVNARCEFGKIVSADYARLWITELTAWEICQCYEFDSVKAVSGYLTGRFVRPTDMCMVSVMQFYKAKNEFKKAREAYYKGEPMKNAKQLLELGISPAIVDSMRNRTITDAEVDSCYGATKADLNALFGIEASNEFRRDTVLTPAGIEFSGDFGLENAPANPKAWYQFGSRIVGWSRIAQICVMELIEPYAVMIVNGDTDSIKVISADSNLHAMEDAVSRLSKSIDAAKRKICSRVRVSYPHLFDSLQGIGHYVLEFESECFCASWNKAYCTYDIDKRDGKRHFSFTLAGIPTGRRENESSCFIGLNGYADRLVALGWTFEQVCDLLLGYNVTLANDIIRMNARSFPEWGSMYFSHVADYLGKTSLVCEPAALALYPMSKTINDTANDENRTNMHIAYANNPNVNKDDVIVYSEGILRI